MIDTNFVALNTTDPDSERSAESFAPLWAALQAMNISQPISSTVQSVSFSFLTSEDVRRISVKQIVNPVLLDDLNRPNVGGLYDPALGPSDRKDL